MPFVFELSHPPWDPKIQVADTVQESTGAKPVDWSGSFGSPQDALLCQVIGEFLDVAKAHQQKAASSGPQVFIVPFGNASGMSQVSTEGERWTGRSRDGKQLYFLSSHKEMTTVEIHEIGESFEVGRPVVLFTFRPSQRMARQGLINYDVSPDGKRFRLVVAGDEKKSPPNSPSELARPPHQK